MTCELKEQEKFESTQIFQCTDLIWEDIAKAQLGTYNLYNPYNLTEVRQLRNLLKDKSIDYVISRSYADCLDKRPRWLHSPSISKRSKEIIALRQPLINDNLNFYFYDGNLWQCRSVQT